MPQLLLVEPDVTETTVTRLQSEGWSVLLAPDSVSCMRLAREDPPDVAVVAARLQDGAGVYLVQRLRALLRTAVTPILAVAGDPVEAQPLIDAGAQDWLKAPVSVDDLLEAIGRHAAAELTFTTAPASRLEDPERLKALRGTGLLDTVPDDEIDRFTRVASTLLEAPTSLVSLVDEERQFFKSAVGLHESLRSSHQTPLSRSYCQWAVSAEEPFVVPDARQDRIVKNSPAIEELDAISYCGIPIFVADQAIGTLCVMDSEPRAWSDKQIAGLQDLADILSTQIGLRAAAR